LHGQGKVVATSHPEFEELSSRFPPNPGTRAVIRIVVSRISTSCGHGVPLYSFRGRRDALDKWAGGKGAEALREYRREKNRVSIDGMPAFADIEASSATPPSRRTGR
jgi:hypothetical protein